MEKLYVVIRTDNWSLMYDSSEEELMFYDDACTLAYELSKADWESEYKVARLDFNITY